MKIANPLMTVWLLSCVFTCTPGLTETNRNLDLKDDEKNQPNDGSQLSRQPNNENDFSQLNDESLKLIIAERKKKKETICSIITTGNTFNAEQSSCNGLTEAPAYEDTCVPCVASKSTKKPKGTKKSECKKQFTTACNTKSPKTKTSSQTNDTGVADGSNKWKKIQNFFFGPPSWPFTKLGKQGGSQKNYSDENTAVPSGCCVQQWPHKHQQYLGGMDETTITIRTYLHPIPNDKSGDGTEERILIREEIIRKKVPNKENIPNEDSILSKELLTEGYSVISNRSILEGEKIPSNGQGIEMSNNLPQSKQINDMEGIPPKQWNDAPERMPTKQLNEVQERLPPKEQMCTNERLPTKQLNEVQERLPPKEQMCTNERLPTKQLNEVQERLPPKEQMCTNERLPTKQLNEVQERLPPKEQMCTNERLPTKQLNEVQERLPPKEQMCTNERLPTKQLNGVQERLPPKEQMCTNERLPTKQLNEVQERLPPKDQMDPNERILSREWIIKQERLPSRQEKILTQVEKLPYKEARSESGILPQKNLINWPERSTTRESLAQREEENIPAKEQLLTKDEINYNNTKEGSIMETLETENTMAIDEPLSEAIEIRYVKQEEVTENKNKKIEIPMSKENSQLPLRPEALIETEQTNNKTSMLKLHPRLKQRQNYGLKSKKLFQKNKEHELTDKNFKRLESNFFNNEKDLTTHEMAKASVENITPKIHKSRSDHIKSALEFEKKITYDTNFFLKAFHQFLKENFPEIINLQENEKEQRNITQGFYPLYRHNSYLFKTKQPSTFNTENNTQLPENKNMYNYPWQYTEPYLTSSLISSAIDFSQATYPYTLVTEANIPKMEYNKIEVNFLKYETTTSGLEEVDNAMLPSQKTEQNMNQRDVSTSPLSQKDFENNYSQNTEATYSSYQQNEVFPTAKNENNPPEVNKALYNPFTTWEPLKENTIQKEISTYEKVITIPQLIFTEGYLSFKNRLPFVDITTPKKQNDYVSNFSSTVNSFYMNNLWGLRKVEFQPHTITPHTSPVSAKFESFDDDIAYDNRHDINSDNHLKATLSPLQSLSSEAEQTEWNDWAPLNIPNLENEFDAMGTSSENTNEVQEIDTHNLQYLHNSNKNLNKFNRKSEQFLLDMGIRRNCSDTPYGVNFSKESAKINSLVVKRPVKKTVARYYEKIGSKEGPLVDSKSGKMVFVKKQRKGYIDSLTESLGKFQRYRNSFHENSVPSMFRKQIHQINFPPLSKKNIDKTVDDSANFMGKSYFKNSNNAHLSTLRNDKLIEYNEKERIDGISTQVMEKDMTNDKVLNNNNWENENAQSTPNEEAYEEINKYSEIEDELNPISTSESFHILKNNNFRGLTVNVDDSMPFLHNQVSSEKPSIEPQEDKSITRLNDKYIHNYRNEKLLANETGNDNDNQIPMSSSNPEFCTKGNGKISKNRVNVLPKFVNDSVLRIINDIDHKNNEISAVQMSLVKIVHKNPELLDSLFDSIPFKTNIINNVNTAVTKDEMLSQLLLKIRDFLHKLVTDQYIKKRSVIEAPLNLNKDKVQSANFAPINNKKVIFQYDIPTSNIFSNHKSHHNNIDEYSHDLIERSPSLFDDNKHYQFSDEWKNSMQSLIDKQNEKRNIQYNIYDEVVQTDPRKLISFAINNNLKHLEILHKPLEKFLENKISRDSRSLNGIHKNNDKQLFLTDSRGKITKRNVLGNKKMKSRELEFILEKNLPSLPLNKGQFITYMMTGMKKPGYPLTTEDEMRSHLSKKNLQSLIDRNSKKDKVVIESSNKRPRKKEWQNTL